MPTPRFALPTWLICTLAAGVCWGVWGVLAKGPSRELSGWMTHILFTIALVPSALYAACSRTMWVGSDKARGIAWGFASGLLAAGGNIAFYQALENGAETAIAIPLTGIYPLVTIAIAYVAFHERLGRIQWLGVALAVVVMILLSGEAGHLGDFRELLHHLALKTWLFDAVAALVLWGVFSATQKLSTNYVSTELSYLSWCASFATVTVFLLATRQQAWPTTAAMWWSGLAAGVFNGCGVIAAFAAYRLQGKAAVVTTIAAAIQPQVTVVLAVVFLGERVGPIEAIGIGLAIVAAVALSQDGIPPSRPGSAPLPPTKANV